MADLLERIDETEPGGVGFDFRNHHVGLSVPDLEAAIAWYRRMLGFAVEFRTAIDAVPFTGAFLRRGRTRIELFMVPGAKPASAERSDVMRDLHTHGTKHMALEVSDVAAAVRELTAKGVDVAMPIMAAGAMAAAYIRDNSGNLIELIEHRDAKSSFPDLHSPGPVK